MPECNMRPPNRSTLLKVVILGDGGVGKSCLMNRFVSNHFDDNSFHTIGVEFLNKDLTINGTKYTLQIWDTAGQERFKALRTPFYRGSDICLLAYAIDDRNSFRSLIRWHDEFLKYADVQGDRFPFMVVGNKCDLEATARQVPMEEVETWCKDYNIASFIETSAKKAHNISEAFELAVKQWKQMERMTEREMRDHGDTIDLTKTIPLNTTKRSCCLGNTSRDNSLANNNRRGLNSSHEQI